MLFDNYHIYSKSKTISISCLEELAVFPYQCTDIVCSAYYPEVDIERKVSRTVCSGELTTATMITGNVTEVTTANHSEVTTSTQTEVTTSNELTTWTTEADLNTTTVSPSSQGITCRHIQSRSLFAFWDLMRRSFLT